MRKILIIVFIIIYVDAPCVAQKRKGIRKYLPTKNISFRKRNKKQSNLSNHKKDKYNYIYVNSLNGILYGNPCALQETRKFGFEYIIESLYGVQSKTPIGKKINNFWIKSKLVLIRTPFWKKRLRKKINRCRSSSGDFIGFYNDR